MILVDTSVWVDHLRTGDRALALLLEEGKVLCHPLIIGELACGNMRRWTEIIILLRSLPEAAAASNDEVLDLIGNRRLMGAGLGFIDMHLLASAQLLSRVQLWTRDRRLGLVASKLGLAHHGEGMPT